MLSRRRFLGLLGLGLVDAPRAFADISAGSATAETAAAARGLARLAATQTAAGCWPGMGGGAGITGTCLLAFLAHGHVPDRDDPHGDAIARAQRWLTDLSRPADGALVGDGPSPAYQHGLATLALAESLGTTTALPGLRRAVDGAVDLICRIQNPRGGWRHDLTPADGDELPASVGHLMALRAAANAGRDVPAEVIARATEYARACQNRMATGGDGGFRYTLAAGDSGWARTGAGCCALQMAGAGDTADDASIAEGLAYLEGFRPLGAIAPREYQSWHFGAYYVTLALWLARATPGGEERWRRFYAGMVDDLLAQQRTDGSWPGEYAPYETAASLLILSFPRDGLPIHQR